MRITSGIFRSRSLVAPRGQETRPTSDRVREAIFSMLTADGVFDRAPGAAPGGADGALGQQGDGGGAANGPRVLDLYAGSGALGLEALSRGARSVVLVEHARPALAAIRENVQSLQVGNQVTVLAMRVDRALKTVDADGPFDLVLVDPPYADVRDARFAGNLELAARLLADGGVLVLEHATSDEPEAPPSAVLDRRRTYGDTTVSLFRSPSRKETEDLSPPRSRSGSPDDAAS